MGDYSYINIASVIQVEDWPSLDEPLAGSRVKTTVSQPNTSNLYIFKQPKEGREAQIWSELIASFIAGDLLGWPVQHTSIAMRGEQVGNLLGYIFNPSRDTFVPGEQLCKHVDPDYDPAQGTRHTWELIKKVHDEYMTDRENGALLVHASNKFNRYWVRTIAFDTLISNSDRHAENWALKFEEDNPEIMSPFYDNGSSMGCENTEESLNKKWFDEKGQIKSAKVQSYTSNGRHHLRNGDHRFKFEDLAILVLNEFPDMRSEYEAIATLDLSPIEQLLKDITSMDGLPKAVQMTSHRSTQIMALLHEGQSRVKRCLEEVE